MFFYLSLINNIRRSPIKDGYSLLLVKTELSLSSVHGIGLFANEDIPAGKEIWRFHRRTCEVFSFKDFVALCEEIPVVTIRNFMNYSYIKNNQIVYISDNTRFMNHDLNPNVTFVDDLHEVAIRDIRKGEELFENYLLSYDKNDFFCEPLLFETDDKEEILKILRSLLC